MRILLIAALSLSFLGACTSTELAIEETSVIPDNHLVVSQKYMDSCLVAYSSDDTISRGEAISLCSDDVFILYGEAHYRVLESGADGQRVEICDGTTIKSINNCIHRTNS